MTDEIASTTPLRVATWNLNHWRQPLLPVDTRRGAWAHLAEGIGAQVALVQEAVPPVDMPRDRAVYGEIAGHRNWGSAVVALDPAVTIEPIRSVRTPWSKRRYLLDAAHPGSTAVARVTVAGLQPITLVSVYGVLDGSALASMHRVVADLLPLFDSPDGARVILGGDLNVTQTTQGRAVPRAGRRAPRGGPGARPRRGQDPRCRAAGAACRLLVRQRATPAATSAPGRARSSTTCTCRRRSPPR